jgi:hypothetical protein
LRSRRESCSKSLMAILLLGGAAAGCCKPTIARLSGQWVLVDRGQGTAGIAAKPAYGAPLNVAASSDMSAGCFGSAVLDQHFGEQCAGHETEGGAASTMTDVLQPGAHPTPGEVRWYCDSHTVLRVLLQRCAQTDTFTVSELAVARTGN